jgi:hypothetical protein
MFLFGSSMFTKLARSAYYGFGILTIKSVTKDLRAQLKTTNDLTKKISPVVTILLYFSRSLSIQVLDN